MTDRGVSTVLDATLCLLLVSAAVVALVTVPAHSDVPADVPSDARATVGTLAASTATVESANGTTNATVANHLADAALLDAADRSAPVFESGVRDATNQTLAGAVGETRAVALARSENRTVGRFHVGPSPPRGTPVESSSFTVRAPESERVERVRLVVQGWSA